MTEHDLTLSREVLMLQDSLRVSRHGMHAFICGRGLIAGALKRWAPGGLKVQLVPDRGLVRAVKARVYEFNESQDGRTPMIIVWAGGKTRMGSSSHEVREEDERFSDWLQQVNFLIKTQQEVIPVFISSGGGLLPPSDLGCITVDCKPSPYTTYGEMKLRQEKSLARLEGDSRVLVVRPSNVFGVRQDGSWGRGFVGALSSAVLRNEELEFLAPPSTTRDFLHAGDLARLTWEWVIELTQEPGRKVTTKLAASGRSYGLQELVDRLALRMTRKPKVRFSKAWVPWGLPEHMSFQPSRSRFEVGGSVVDQIIDDFGLAGKSLFVNDGKPSTEGCA